MESIGVRYLFCEELLFCRVSNNVFVAAIYIKFYNRLNAREQLDIDKMDFDKVDSKRQSKLTFLGLRRDEDSACCSLAKESPPESRRTLLLCRTRPLCF